MNAPYYTLYHNTNQDQYRSLVNVINQARTYDLWYPSLEEFGQFGKTRETVLVSADIDPAKMIAQVTNAFAGLSLTFRLPDGTAPGTVFINGSPAD